MSTQYELNANLRQETGKANSRRSRRFDNTIPAVLYGSKKDNVLLNLDHNAFSLAMKKEGFASHILTLNYADSSEQVMIKAIQRHPFKKEFLHVDLLRVNASEKVTINVAVHLENADTSVGLKAGGMLSQPITEVEITCLPSRLPEALHIDITDLAIEQAKHLSDIKLPEGVSLTTDISDEAHNHAVVAIHKAKESTDTAEEDTTSADDAKKDDE